MNTLKATRWVGRLGVPLLLVCALALYWHFDLLAVPEGMDTMPETHPAGTICLIEKSPSGLVQGSVVFVDLPDGSTVLTRVAAVFDDGAIAIRHDNRASVFCYLEQSNPYPATAVRGLVLTMFVGQPQGVPRSGG